VPANAGLLPWAGGGGGRRYQSIADAVGECSECHVVSIGIQLNTGLFVHCCDAIFNCDLYLFPAAEALPCN